MNSKFIKGGLWFLTASIGSEVLWQLFLFARSKMSSSAGSKEIRSAEEISEETRAFHARKPPDLWNTVLFFPDLSPDPTDPDSTTSKLMFYLENAKMCLQICIFLASLPVFERVILRRKREGLCIQVITDHDTMRAHNNYCCHKFSRVGIPVRTKNTGRLMHNKFIIIDDEALLTGSLNLTKQAICSNSENVVVTTDPRIVLKYKQQFAVLWRESEDVE